MRHIYFILFSFLSIVLSAQKPGYYNGIDFSTSKNEIKSQLSALLRNTHYKKLSYTPGVWIALKDLDQDPENHQNVLLVYGSDDTDHIWSNDRSRDKNMTCNNANCTNGWNREHIYPKSIGEFRPDGFAYTDVHALRAGDPQMNIIRFNNPYDDGDGYAGLVTKNSFYPGDEWKGDVARMILYMYLRYPKNCKPIYVGKGSRTYSTDIPDIFLEWNAEDPVSEFEKRRNNLIEDKYQGNRNPFIDNPYIATMIWGGPKAQNLWENMDTQDIETDEIHIYPNPTQKAVYYNEKGFSSILIYDSTGKQVKEDMDLSDNKTVLPETAGLYIIDFCRDNRCKSIKVIKQ